MTESGRNVRFAGVCNDSTRNRDRFRRIFPSSCVPFIALRVARFTGGRFIDLSMQRSIISCLEKRQGGMNGISLGSINDG